jgi:hypothetical protein
MVFKYESEYECTSLVMSSALHLHQGVRVNDVVNSNVMYLLTACDKQNEMMLTSIEETLADRRASNDVGLSNWPVMM